MSLAAREISSYLRQLPNDFVMVTKLLGEARSMAESESGQKRRKCRLQKPKLMGRQFAESGGANTGAAVGRASDSHGDGPQNGRDSQVYMIGTFSVWVRCR